MKSNFINRNTEIFSNSRQLLNHTDKCSSCKCLFLLSLYLSLIYQMIRTYNLCSFHMKPSCGRNVLENHQGWYLTLHPFILVLNIWTNSYCFISLERLFHIIGEEKRKRLRIISKPSTIPVDTGRKLKVHKTFRGLERLLDVICTFNLRPVSTRYIRK